MSSDPRGPDPRGGVPWARFLVVAVLLALDLWTKSAAFAYLEGAPAAMRADVHGHPRVPLVGDWLALMRSENPGAAFGRFGEWPWVLVGGRVVAVCVLAVALWRTRREHPLLLAGVALVLAGAAGNLWDNLSRIPADGSRPFGTVRDFIDVYFPFWDWHFPTFNVADSCITVGAICFLLHGLFDREPADDAAEARAADPA